MTDAVDLEEKQMRAMVALVEAQTEQLQTLRGAVESLEARVALRSELDIIVAQELRTPLSVVTDSLTELKALKPGDPDFDDVVERATVNSNYLNDVVNELLRPWSGEGPVFDRRHLESISIGEIIDQAVKTFIEAGSQERITVEGERDFPIRTSPPRLMGIIVNVLQHALDHSKEPVTLQVERTIDGLLKMTITNAGTSEENPDQAFEPFGSDLSSDKPARGIGLYLVRMLARSLGGEIILSPTSNGSTEAIIQLPQRRADDPPQEDQVSSG